MHVMGAKDFRAAWVGRVPSLILLGIRDGQKNCEPRPNLAIFAKTGLDAARPRLMSVM